MWAGKFCIYYQVAKEIEEGIKMEKNKDQGDMIRTFEPQEDGSCCQHQQYITSRAHSCQCAKDSILAPAPECLQAVAARGHLPMGLECPTTHPQPALHSYHKLLTKLAHMYTYLPMCAHCSL
jgi:hypothetical protein